MSQIHPIRNFSPPEKEESFLLRQLFFDFFRKNQIPELTFSMISKKEEIVYLLEEGDDKFLEIVKDVFIELFKLKLTKVDDSFRMLVNRTNMDLLTNLLLEDFPTNSAISYEKEKSASLKKRTPIKKVSMSLFVPRKTLKKIIQIFVSIIRLAIEKGMVAFISKNDEGSVYDFSLKILDEIGKVFVNELKIKSYSPLITKTIIRKYESFFSLTLDDENLEKLSHLFANKILYGVEYSAELNEFLNSTVFCF